MKVTWKLPDGSEVIADVADGQTLMQAALDNDVAGILGECGGNLSCSTCHVVVEPNWQDRAGPPGEFEEAMLDATEAPRRAASRLSCQITAGLELDGLVLIVPPV